MASKALNETTINRVERIRVRRVFLFVASGYAERRRSIVIQARARNESPSSQIPLSNSTQTPKDLFAGAGFTATKKIGGAVARNRAKRRMREASNLLMCNHALAGVDYVFIARQDTGTREWSRLLDDIESALISLRQKILSGAPPDPKPNHPSQQRKGQSAVGVMSKKN